MDTFNLDYLLNLSDGDLGFAIEVMDEFLSTIDALMESVRQAMSRDPRSALPYLHALKGSSGSAGAERLADAARRLEASVVEGETDSQEKAMVRIEDELDAAVRAMKRQLASAA